MANRRPAAQRQQTPDDRWNQQMTRILREAAEVREQRSRTRASEDDLSAEREAAGLTRLIESYDRPKARHPDPGAAAGSSAEGQS